MVFQRKSGKDGKQPKSQPKNTSKEVSQPPNNQKEVGNKRSDVSTAVPQAKEKINIPIEILFVLIFTATGLYTRFYELDFPAEVVFDEQHFGKFVNWYFRGEYFLDIHPPLGKLLLMLSGHLFGYNPEINYDNISDPYTDDSYLALRVSPAFFGALLVPLTYLTMRVMKISRAVSCLVAWLVLCENILITESRYILCDSYLFFFSTLAIFFSSIAIYQCTPQSFSWTLSLILCGLSLGSAMSVKFTALGLLGSILVQHFIDLFERYNRKYQNIFLDIFTRSAALIIPGVILFVGFFLIHFWLLPYPGDGDAFMSSAFRARLVHPDGTPQQEYIGQSPLGIVDAFIELLSTMHAVNIGLKATHPFQSYWYEWPILLAKPVLYWQEENSWIYCMGNPLAWISVVIALIVFLIWTAKYAVGKFFFAVKKVRGKKKQVVSVWDYVFCKYFWRGSFLAVSYLGNLLPFAMIPRATWNYHYIPALLIGYMLLGLVVQILLDHLKISKLDSANSLFRLLLIGFLVFSTGSFLYYLPWTYGLPLPHAKLMDRFLLHSWIV